MLEPWIGFLMNGILEQGWHICAQTWRFGFFTVKNEGVWDI
jgi:hypothetical protein